MSVDEPAWIRLADNVGFQEYGPVPAEPATVYYNPAVAHDGYQYNPAKARKLLESHGWHLKNGVMTNKAGQTLTFNLLYASGSTWVENAAVLYQSDLKQVGIVLKLSDEPFNQLVATTATTHTWQIAWDGGGWCYEPDYYPTGAGLFVPGATANRGQFSNPTLTRLIDLTHAAGSNAVEMQRMFAYELEAAKLLPVLFLPVTGGFNGTVDWLKAPASAWNPVQAITQFNLWSTTAP
jgi:peptide/nickel transport system substrate-binding protein